MVELLSDSERVFESVCVFVWTGHSKALECRREGQLCTALCGGGPVEATNIMTGTIALYPALAIVLLQGEQQLDNHTHTHTHPTTPTPTTHTSHNHRHRHPHPHPHAHPPPPPPPTHTPTHPHTHTHTHRHTQTHTHNLSS